MWPPRLLTISLFSTAPKFSQNRRPSKYTLSQTAQQFEGTRRLSVAQKINRENIVQSPHVNSGLEKYNVCLSEYTSRSKAAPAIAARK